MKYKGEILSDEIPADDIYSFLKKTLKQTPNDQQFRGPKKLIDKKFKYTNNIKGGIKKFSGEEKIFYENKLAYILVYSGKTI